MRLWFEEDPQLYEAVHAAVDAHLPTLHLHRMGDRVLLRGGIVIEDAGVPIERYSVEIEFPSDYPKTDPFVRETSGKIPKTADNHVDENGVACLFLTEVRWRHCPADCTIDQFVNGPVRAFFEWHTYRTLTGKLPPGGEWKHGLDGILQFYREEAGSDDLCVLMVFLKYLAAKKVRNQWPCYCGSGRKLRDCHLGRVIYLRERLDRARTSRLLEALEEAKRRVLTEIRSNSLHGPKPGTRLTSSGRTP